MFAGVDVTGVDDLVSSPSARVATPIAQNAQRSESRCAAAKVIAAGRLHAIRFAAISAGDDRMGPPFGNIADKGATVEVATALGVSSSKATTIIGLSILLDDLSGLRAAFLHGNMDFYRVNMIATTISGHEPLVRKQLEAEAIRLDADTAMSHRQLRDRLEEMCIELDPEQAVRDREAFGEQQDFRVKPDRHGHSAITGCVPAQDGKEIEARVVALVATLCPGDPRRIGQKRVAALLALVRGEATLSCWCGAIDPALAHSLSADAPWRMLYGDTLTVLSPTSASGAGRGPLQSAGTLGCIRARHHQTAGHTPAPGPPREALTYAPSQSLRDWINEKPPIACEIDHQIPFDHSNPAAGGRS